MMLDEGDDDMRGRQFRMPGEEGKRIGGALSELLGTYRRGR
jgi:hypothetical protein